MKTSDHDNIFAPMPNTTQFTANSGQKSEDNENAFSFLKPL